MSFLEEKGSANQGGQGDSLSDIDHDSSHYAGDDLGKYQEDGSDEDASKNEESSENEPSQKGENPAEKNGEGGQSRTGNEKDKKSDKGGHNQSRASRIGSAAKDVKAVISKNPQAIAGMVKRRAKLWLLGLLIGSPVGLLLVGVFFVLILIVMLIGGAEQEALSTGFCESAVGDLSCASNKASNQGFDSCYYSALRVAEDKTDVPWQILAAADYKVWNQGAIDARGVTNLDALLELGDEIQRANYKRDPVTGNVLPGSDGQPIKGISHDGTYAVAYNDLQDFGHAGSVLKLFECMWVDAEGNHLEQENIPGLIACLNCPAKDEFSKMLLDPWISMNSKVPGMELPDGSVATYENTGALSFYNFLMHNCASLGLADYKPGQGGGGGGGGGMGEIGTPGQRNENNIPVLNNWKQGDWCGGAPWWNDPTWWGCNMADCGCGIASAAMVAAWYGCSIDPGILNGAVGTSGSEGQVWATAASACGLSFQTQPGVQAARDFLISTHEPMVVNVMGNICGTYSGGHFVAVAGFDGTNYYVYDPGCCGDVFTVPASTFEGMMSSSSGTNISFYK